MPSFTNFHTLNFLVTILITIPQFVKSHKHNPSI